MRASGWRGRRGSIHGGKRKRIINSARSYEVNNMAPLSPWGRVMEGKKARENKRSRLVRSKVQPKPIEFHPYPVRHQMSEALHWGGGTGGGGTEEF